MRSPLTTFSTLRTGFRAEKRVWRVGANCRDLPEVWLRANADYPAPQSLGFASWRRGPEFESSPGIATDGIVTAEVMRAWLGTDGDFTGLAPPGVGRGLRHSTDGIRRASHPPRSPGCSCQRTRCVAASYGAALNRWNRNGPVQSAGAVLRPAAPLLTLTNGALRATSELSSWTAARLYRVRRPQRDHSPRLAWT